MNIHTLKIFLFRSTLLPLLLSSCAYHPHNVDVTLKNELPETKVTAFSRAISNLGLMTRIYATNTAHVMSTDIVDNTGTSIATTAEIPRDVTNMIKSTLNGIGGNIVFIPYDPSFIVNAANTGYSNFGNKLVPHVIVSGGITEFDRGLQTRGKGSDIGLEADISGVDINLEYSTNQKLSLAQITLDFNMIDFNTFSGIQQVQAINTVRVKKGLGEDSLAFTVKGNGVGLLGNIKKVQGRHAAVRLIVQLSMIQIIGKYLNIPYWNLLPGVEADPVVLQAVATQFYSMSERERILKTQEYLNLNGHPVALSGIFDSQTQTALAAFTGQSVSSLNDRVYLKLFSSVPIQPQTLAWRQSMHLLAQPATTQNFKSDGSKATVNKTKKTKRQARRRPPKTHKRPQRYTSQWTAQSGPGGANAALCKQANSHSSCWRRF